MVRTSELESMVQEMGGWNTQHVILQNGLAGSKEMVHQELL